MMDESMEKAMAEIVVGRQNVVVVGGGDCFYCPFYRLELNVEHCELCGKTGELGNSIPAWCPLRESPAIVALKDPGSEQGEL